MLSRETNLKEAKFLGKVEVQVHDVRPQLLHEAVDILAVALHEAALLAAHALAGKAAPDVRAEGRGLALHAVRAACLLPLRGLALAADLSCDR